MIKIKIAVSSSGKDINSQIDLRFGRCPYYLIVDIENNEIKDSKALENPAMYQGGGAGMAAAEFVANEKVEVVITGNIGPNAFSVLQQLNIKIYKSEGIIKDIIQQFIGGKLQELNTPTSPLNFGRGPGMGMGGGGQGRGMGRGRGMGQGRGGGRGQGGGFGRGNM